MNQLQVNLKEIDSDIEKLQQLRHKTIIDAQLECRHEEDDLLQYPDMIHSCYMWLLCKACGLAEMEPWSIMATDANRYDLMSDLPEITESKGFKLSLTRIDRDDKDILDYPMRFKRPAWQRLINRIGKAMFLCLANTKQHIAGGRSCNEDIEHGWHTFKPSMLESSR